MSIPWQKTMISCRNFYASTWQGTAWQDPQQSPDGSAKVCSEIGEKTELVVTVLFNRKSSGLHRDLQSIKRSASKL